ncbi:MAG: hypothetical protein R2851_27105 [Caldilineaceae bacterium]
MDWWGGAGAGQHHRRADAGALLDTMERYVCYVGGLPQVRTWPFAHKAVFSPRHRGIRASRPLRGARCRRGAPGAVGRGVAGLPGVGTLEAFNTDGLRTLRHTLDAPS